MVTNIETLTGELRAAVGASVPMIGLTYPDVTLGAWVTGASGQALARESVTAFKLAINPALEAAYAPSKVTFVDTTAGSGAYIPLTRTTTLSPYGTVPVAVAKVCVLTWFCSQENIHPTDAGYALIASEMAKAYRSLAG